MGESACERGDAGTALARGPRHRGVLPDPDRLAPHPSGCRAVSRRGGSAQARSARYVWRVLLPLGKSEDARDSQPVPAGARRRTAARVCQWGHAGFSLRSIHSRIGCFRRTPFLCEQSAGKPCRCDFDPDPESGLNVELPTADCKLLTADRKLLTSSQWASFWTTFRSRGSFASAT